MFRSLVFINTDDICSLLSKIMFFFLTKSNSSNFKGRVQFGRCSEVWLLSTQTIFVLYFQKILLFFQTKSYNSHFNGRVQFGRCSGVWLLSTQTIFVLYFQKIMFLFLTKSYSSYSNGRVQFGRCSGDIVHFFTRNRRSLARWKNYSLRSNKFVHETIKKKKLKTNHCNYRNFNEISTKHAKCNDYLNLISVSYYC